MEIGNREGVFTKKLQKGPSSIQRRSWFNERGLGNSVIVLTGMEKKLVGKNKKRSQIYWVK